MPTGFALMAILTFSRFVVTSLLLYIIVMSAAAPDEP